MDNNDNPKETKYDSNDPKSLMEWGDSLSNQGYFKEAIDKYKQVDALYPNHPITLTNWGIALRGLDLHNKAIIKFERANKALPNHPDI